MAASASLPCITVAAGIIWQDGHFLAALRPAGKPKAGYWEFPGGKLESGETPTQALIRELNEELGIIVQQTAPWRVVEHAYPDVRVTLHFIHVTAFFGVPVMREGQTLRWVTVEESRTMPFLPADIALLRELEAPK